MTSGRDGPWFEQVSRTHEPAVRRYAARRVGVDAADEIVAEVFTTLWRRRADAPEALLPWLYNVAANHLAHWARTAARQARLRDELVSDAVVSTQHGPAASDPGIQAVLVQLPAPDAEILRLAHWEQLAPREIAIVLGCSVNSARVRLHNARR